VAVLLMHPSLSRPGHRHEVRAFPAALNDPVGDAIVVERKMPDRDTVWRINDGITDDPDRHPATPSHSRSASGLSVALQPVLYDALVLI